MKLVVVCFWFLFGVAVWRCASRRLFVHDQTHHDKSPIGRIKTHTCVQALLHRLPPCLTGLLQWYGLFFLGFCVLMAFTYQTNISLMRAHWLSKAMPTFVRRVSKASLVAGVVGFLFLSAHFVHAALAGSAWRRARRQDYPWAPSTRQDIVFCVLSVPAVYIAMSVQSTARMWMVIENEFGPTSNRFNLGLYRQNLVLCAVCQYWVVWVFSKLCWEFVRERTSEETRLITKYAGFQGVHAFVLVGMVQCGLEFGMAYAESRAAHEDYWNEIMEQHGDALTTARSKVDDLLVAMTVLCIYNMLLICRFEPITDALGNANAKFLGIRMLLMLRTIQPKVLHFSNVQHALELDANTSKLLHSSLLTFECLLVILFNFFSWEFGARKELLYDARSLKERREEESRDDEYQCLDNES